MTPESALGRLINLREQLTTMNADLSGIPSKYVVFSDTNYSAIIDDLDDIIRSIERGMNVNCKCCGREKELDDRGVCFSCWEREKEPDSEDYTVVPDSEDTERR